MESTGEMELALQYYEMAEDYLSLVRVYSYCDNLEKAAEIANMSGDKAACYHLARQYENIDNIAEAIHFFSKAQAYSNAIRICKEQGYTEQLWNMAVLGEKHAISRNFCYIFRLSKISINSLLFFPFTSRSQRKIGCCQIF